MIDLTKLSEIKIFIDECKSGPSLFSTPSLAFFREYLESLGANLPNAAYEEEDKDTKSKSFVVQENEDDVEGTVEPKQKLEEDEEQSLIVALEDVDLQGETFQPDYDPTKKMDLSHENREAAQELKGKAMVSVSEGKFYKAVQHLTCAISMNPTSTILYGHRACVYIKLRNPKAAFRDAVTALEINPDSAKGYKARGMACAMLGDWAEAEKDLHLASMIDYDEEISDDLKEIDPHINKIGERWRPRRHAEAQAAYDKAQKQEQSSSNRQDAKKQERSSARQKAKKQGHSSSNRHSVTNCM